MSNSLYIALYYNILLLIVLFVCIQPVRRQAIEVPYTNNRRACFFILLLVFIHITFRVTDYHYFGDTSAYALAFEEKARYGTEAIGEKDFGFEYLTLWLSKLVNLRGYWFILCCLYVLPVYWAFRKQFPKQYAIALMLFVCSFSFWGYGVNGLRNGIATSLVIYSFLAIDNEIKRIPIWIIACLAHQSVMLPIAVFLLTRYLNEPKYYLLLWCATFLFMLVAPGVFGTVLSDLPWFEQDDRMSRYLAGTFENAGSSFSSTGFRWDFVLYSFVPIGLGTNFINAYSYKDGLYKRLFNTYVACNAFWLLTIYIPFNNRFAYLSWFLYPVILIYPLLKENLVKSQGIKVKVIVLLNYLFTYVMWIR